MQQFEIGFIYDGLPFDAICTVTHFYNQPPSFDYFAASSDDYYGYREINFTVTYLTTLVEDPVTELVERLEWKALSDDCDATYCSELWLAKGRTDWLEKLYATIEDVLISTIEDNKGEK